VLLNAEDLEGWLVERSGGSSPQKALANPTTAREAETQANAASAQSVEQNAATLLASEEIDGSLTDGSRISRIAAQRRTEIITGEDEDKEALASMAGPPDALEAVHQSGRERSIARTWRFGDLCDMWAKASGRDRREILEQLAQDFFAGAFEGHGQAETLSEAANERIASRSPIPVRVDDLLPHMAAAFRREVLSRAKAATLSIRDWERMGEHGHLVVRLIEGLRLTQPALHRWYRTAHLLERPPIWPAYPSGEAMPEQGSAVQKVAASPTMVAEPRQPTTPAPAKVRRGRRDKYDWLNVMTGLRAKLEEDGCPRPGDGGQARLEEWVIRQFHPDSCPGESMVRARVAQEIKSYQAFLGIEAGN
jgi:hypothetical protein